MRRFVARVATFLLLQSIVVTFVIAYGVPGHGNNYLAAFDDKVRRLEQCRGPRLVVLGGSNVAFGFNSPLMEQSLGMETVNLGLHVMLGLSFPMDCYLQHARRGDIVILCPEYHLLTSPQHQQGDPKLVNRLIEQCPRAKRYLPGATQSSWKQFFDHDALWIAHQWVGRAFRNARDRNEDEKIYGRRGFNQFGDMIAHHDRVADEWVPLDPVPESTPECLQQSIDALNRFEQECRNRGVTVYFSYPPLEETTFADSQQVIENLHRAIEKHVEIPLLHSPEAFALDRKCLYDTGYHLNEESGKQRTLRLAEAIRQRQQDRPAAALASRYVRGFRIEF